MARREIAPCYDWTRCKARAEIGGADTTVQRIVGSAARPGAGVAQLGRGARFGAEFGAGSRPAASTSDYNRSVGDAN
jgi:hypothetical protein